MSVFLARVRAKDGYGSLLCAGGVRVATSLLAAAAAIKLKEREQKSNRVPSAAAQIPAKKWRSRI